MIISWMLFLVLQEDPLVIAPLKDYSTEEICKRAIKAIVLEESAKVGCMPIAHKGV